MLDQAFEALKGYNWGTDRKPLEEIDAAVAATHGDAAARKDLESRLGAALKTDISRDAKDYVCRKLMIVGTAACVPVLAEMLSNKDLAHMSRFALERIPGPEASKALRDALPKLSGALKIGAITSIGARRDAESVSTLAALAGDVDAAVAKAVITALGDLRTAEAAKALSGVKPTDATNKIAAVDANLVCAEGLLAAGKKTEALAIYKMFSGDEQPSHVRFAGKRGMVLCLGK